MELFQNRYKIFSKLGRGSYGTVYSAYDTLLGINVAIKLNDTRISLSHEVSIYNLLNCDQSPIGIPQLYTYVVDAKQEFFVMQLLGPSLRSLCQARGDRFSFKTVAMLGIQMITRLESLHDSGFVHCDVKDDNFVIFDGTVYIIDFGLCKTFIDPNTREHVKETTDSEHVGTSSFSSMHTCRKMRSTRRDDMESLGYLFVRWLKRFLPWDQSPGRDLFCKVYQEAGFTKEAHDVDTLCESLPEEFRTFMYHVKNLRFDERPNYAYLRCLLNSLLGRLGESNDGIYDWMYESGVVF